jgi:ABC-2 type transport system permease protein
MNLALNLVAVKTIIRKEMVRVLRIWIQTIVPDYMQYIAPGLIMMSVITNSYGNVVSSFFGAKFGRHLEEMLVAPMSYATIIIGHVAGGVLRGLLVGMLVTIIALFFTNLQVAHPFIMISIVLLSSIVFALAGFINAVFAKKFDDISIVPTFVLTPLTYLGGVFYSISMLPEFWQNVSKANPILYMVNAFRYGVLGSSDIGIGYAYTILIAFVVLLFSGCMFLMQRGIGIRE